MELLKSLFTHDITVRAVKTFVQAFLAALTVSVAGVHDLSTAKVALIAAASAGVSAVWNTVLQARA